MVLSFVNDDTNVKCMCFKCTSIEKKRRTEGNHKFCLEGMLLIIKFQKNGYYLGSKENEIKPSQPVFFSAGMKEYMLT